MKMARWPPARQPHDAAATGGGYERFFSFERQCDTIGVVAGALERPCAHGEVNRGWQLPGAPATKGAAVPENTALLPTEHRACVCTAEYARFGPKAPAIPQCSVGVRGPVGHGGAGPGKPANKMCAKGFSFGKATHACDLHLQQPSGAHPVCCPVHIFPVAAKSRRSSPNRRTDRVLHPGAAALALPRLDLVRGGATPGRAPPAGSCV